MEQEKVTRTLSPARWAIDISRILNQVFGPERFPVDVAAVAQEISLKRFPDDPITAVMGASLPRFDGALFADPAGQKGWAIVYNDSIESCGRINFTLAHEFGHYLLHRKAYPKGFSCGQQDIVRWDSEYGKLERQANEFAANLLMPLDDFRSKVDPRGVVTLAQLGEYATRYMVSQIAATLRWLSFTQRRAVLVVSREGFILWARSSDRALKTGAFFRTSRGSIAIPAASLAVSASTKESAENQITMEAGTWFQTERCTETAIVSEHYDFALSLLQLEDESPRQTGAPTESDGEEDLCERITRIHGLRQ